ncbi:MAG: hypothetical protein ACREF8_06645 [Chthoniobacterales bacterium]
MDLYLFCLSLGFLGLIAIALLGHSHGHASGHSHGHGHAAHGHTHTNHLKAGAASFLHDWASPRVLFSLVFAFGATGILLQHLLPAVLVVVIALAAAWTFERWLVQPIWRVLFGFASNPARTLESAVLEEVEAVTNFDQRGQGLVALQLDGEVVQLLASLSPNEQRTGARVRAGDRLSITGVNAKRNSCTVTRLPFASPSPAAPLTP